MTPAPYFPSIANDPVHYFEFNRCSFEPSLCMGFHETVAVNLFSAQNDKFLNLSRIYTAKMARDGMIFAKYCLDLRDSVWDPAITAAIHQC
jgi:hypothetical protein